MLPFLTRKKVPLSGWALLLLILFVGVCGINDAWADSEELEFRNKITLFGGVTQEGSEIDGSIGLGATVHPYAGLYFLIGPGIEIVDRKDEGNEESFIFRLGVGYDFELTPRWSLAPEFNVDFVSGGDNALVYGLVLGYAF